ncbi:MAG: aspartyl protease family protein [Gemmataceae bacterium]
MSLTFPYCRVRTTGPVPSLGGRMERPRPIVAVTLLGPSGVVARDCLVDTGADDTVFPETFAARIGIDLVNAPTGSAAGVGLHAAAIRYAVVTLRLGSGTELLEWQACVGFTSVALRRPLLGYAGFLQFFTAAFHGDRERLELDANPTYPGR